MEDFTFVATYLHVPDMLGEVLLNGCMLSLKETAIGSLRGPLLLLFLFSLSSFLFFSLKNKESLQRAFKKSFSCLFGGTEAVQKVQRML